MKARRNEERRVVFVCPHGAARSVLAAAQLDRLAAQSGVAVRATAAGLAPDPVVAPAVAAALFAEGVNVSGLRPRRVTPEELAAAWRVVALGCDPGALAPPGVEVLRWDDVPSPSEHYTAARDLLAGRIAELLAP
ncbi:MAG TPA: heat-shock protein HtpX [Candidatus Rokubacteria bacterium]|nr:heat-shock protein HtpX [Candidatus Rokubacteria bacterium]